MSQVFKFKENAKVTNPFAKTNKAYTDADLYIYNNGRNDRKKIAERINAAEKLYQQVSVAYIIESDNHKPANTDISRVAAKIISAANYAGVSADSLACIVKKESHFRQNTSRGPIEISSVVIKNLYEKPQAYDCKLKELISKYRTLSKVFEAKKTNNFLDLGKLGDLLYRYENWKKLNSAIRTDYELNLKIGAFLYKSELDTVLANKNIKIADKEKEAFKSYNNAYSKNNYTNSFATTLKSARTSAANDRKYLAAVNKTNDIKIAA